LLVDKYFVPGVAESFASGDGIKHWVYRDSWLLYCARKASGKTIIPNV